MKNLKHALCMMSACLWAIVSIAQPTGNGSKELPLTKEMKAGIVGTFIRELKEHYIFPEIAAKLETKLNADIRDGIYDTVHNHQQFAGTLTTAIRDIAKDNHLGIKYKPQGVNKPARPADKTTELQMPVSWKVMDGNTGYIRIDLFDELPLFSGPVDKAFKALHETNALVIDLRKCRGGSPTSEQYLISHFFDSTGVPLSSIFERKGPAITEEKFSVLKELPSPKYTSGKVYILTGATTFSAAEHFTYDMQVLKRAFVIGTKTRGGANPGDEFSLGHSFYSFIPTGRSYNPVTQSNWEGIGIRPDQVTTEDAALDEAHKIARKPTR